MKTETKKWLCPHARARFIPPTLEAQEALKLLTRRTSASHEQIKALRILGAYIPAAVVTGKNEIDV